MSRPSFASDNAPYANLIPISGMYPNQPGRFWRDGDSASRTNFPANPFRVFTERQLDKIPQLELLSRDQRFSMKVVSSVLPFRVNQYVIDNLIDWADVPDDPIFQLTFPQPGMLSPENFGRMADLIKSGASKAEIDAEATQFRAQLNPHPAGQQELNVPMLGDEVMEGMQHKYRETVLFLPSQGQTCHSYCTF